MVDCERCRYRHEGLLGAMKGCASDRDRAAAPGEKRVSREESAGQLLDRAQLALWPDVNDRAGIFDNFCSRSWISYRCQRLFVLLRRLRAVSNSPIFIFSTFHRQLANQGPCQTRCCSDAIIPTHANGKPNARYHSHSKIREVVRSTVRSESCRDSHRIRTRSGRETHGDVA